MQTQKEITVGQIWEEVDPRLIRKVRVVEVASLEGPKGILIENVESGRKNWASSSRFNGKRGGYRLIWGQFGYQNYCTLRLFFDLSTLAGLSRRNLPEAGIRLLFQI